MKKIVLIPCVKKKLDKKSRASDLYARTLFKKNLQYAESLKPDLIFILSAKCGLLNLEEVISHYDLTLNSMKQDEMKAWAKEVISQLNIQTDLNTDEFIFLAGNNYRKYIIPYIKNHNTPMEGFKFGAQLQW